MAVIQVNLDLSAPWTIDQKVGKYQNDFDDDEDNDVLKKIEVRSVL